MNGGASQCRIAKQLAIFGIERLEQRRDEPNSGCFQKQPQAVPLVGPREAVFLALGAAAAGLASVAAGASGRAGVAPARMAAEVARQDVSGHSDLAW